MSELVDARGCYSPRGALILAIGKLMQMNNELFGMGYCYADLAPVRRELAIAIEQIRVAMDGDSI